MRAAAAAMSLTATTRGFVVLLLTVTVMHSQDGWYVTYTYTHICAFKGSTVEMHCRYSYPFEKDGLKTIVEKRFWFSKDTNNIFGDLRTDPEYSGRVRYHCGDNYCTLRITDLRKSDSAQYKFRFTTNQPGGSLTGSPGVTLSVADLQVSRSLIRDSDSVELKCQSGCLLTDHQSYIWYSNGRVINGQTSQSYLSNFHPTNRISCAVNGHENSPSPSVLVKGPWDVTYSSTQICAFKGSTVEIHCSYTHPPATRVTETFWFTKMKAGEYVKLKDDSQYARRVEYSEKSCSLTIRSLRESDSAQYKFRFTTNQPGGSFTGSPGVTLSVTEPQLQVHVRRSTVDQSPTTELTCHSSCQRPDYPSYDWYNNGVKVLGGKRYLYLQTFGPSDGYYCAVQGQQHFPSRRVYAPKLPSVSVSPSAEIVEGSSVNLTCSSDANPAATYTWFKKHGNAAFEPLSKESHLYFSSIQSSDSGEFYCTAESELGRISTSKTVDVKYAPKLPSVSVSPSAELVEGSSVNLTCSSDANPAATYTWYKENEDSPKASGQIFTITGFRAEHSGNYYCEAQNTRGRHTFTVRLTVAVKSTKVLNITRFTLVVLMLIPLIVLSLWTRKKKSVNLKPEQNEPVEMMELNCRDYENVSALQGVTAAQRDDQEEQEDLV